jgi:hypothetical protein
MSASEPIRERKEPFRFRLLHVFYAMAILGASLATCGVGGIFVAAAILGIWFAVFWGNWPTPEMKDKPPEVRSFTLAELLVVIAVIAVLIALLLPAVRRFAVIAPTTSSRSRWRCTTITIPTAPSRRRISLTKTGSRCTVGGC